VEASTLTHAHRRGRLHVRSSLLRLQKDDRLIALMRRGHEASFEVLVERYRSRLLAFCRNMLGSTEDAEDVLQEVFVAAYKAILADDREITVKPWLYRIARNRCLNHLRRPVAIGQDTMDDRPHAGGITTHERVAQREDFRNLLEDIRELPETQRTALLLREMEALSYEEISEAMDTTVPSVKSLLVRARVSLAEASEARALTCGEVRVQLAEATEGLSRVSGPIRRHLRECEECRGFRSQLRADSKAMAILFPIGPLALLKAALLPKLTGAAAGGSGAATAGGSAGAGSTGGIGGAIAGALAGKATAGVVTAALLTTGVVELHQQTTHHSAPASPAPIARPAALGNGQGLQRALERRRGVHRRSLLHPEANRPVAEKADRGAPQGGGDLAPANTLQHQQGNSSTGGVAAPGHKKGLSDPTCRCASGASIGHGGGGRGKGNHVGLPPAEDSKPGSALDDLPVSGKGPGVAAVEFLGGKGQARGERVAQARKRKRHHRQAPVQLSP
jgi:RNA polymerase sigma factor (sigma-70 family)